MDNQLLRMKFIEKHGNIILGAIGGLYAVAFLFYMDSIGVLKEIKIISILFSLGTKSINILLPKNIYLGSFGFVVVFLLFSLPYVLIGMTIVYFVGKIRKKR